MVSGGWRRSRAGVVLVLQRGGPAHVRLSTLSSPPPPSAFGVPGGGGRWAGGGGAVLSHGVRRGHGGRSCCPVGGPHRGRGVPRRPSVCPPSSSLRGGRSPLGALTGARGRAGAESARLRLKPFSRELGEGRGGREPRLSPASRRRGLCAPQLPRREVVPPSSEGGSSGVTG